MRVLLIALVALWPTWAAAQDDRGFIQGLLEDALSAEGRSVRITGFAGALSSRATIEQITVSDQDGVWLSAEDVALVWSRRALLSGEIDIEEISVARLALPRAPLPPEAALPSAASSGRFALPDLPVSVRLEALDLAEIVIGAPFLGEEITLAIQGAADLRGGQGTASLDVVRQDKGGSLRLQGAFDNATRVLGLDMTLAEPAGGIAATALGLPDDPSVTLALTGDAPLSDYTATLRLATNGQDRLSGTLRLRDEDDTQVFDLDVGGDLAPLLAPQYRAFLGPQVTLVTTGQRQPDGALALETLALDAEALSLAGSARIGADGWPERFDLDGQISAQSGDPVLLPLPGTPTRVQSAQIDAGFDAASDDEWRLETVLNGLSRPDLRLEDATLRGTGRIARQAQTVDGALVLDARGLQLADAALAGALGDRLRGALAFDWSPGAPLVLSEMDLSGSDYGLRGAVTFGGITDGLNVVVEPDVTLRADRLARFGPLVGQALDGSAMLDIAGRVEPLSGAFDLSLAGQTQDLATGVARLDPILRGSGQVDLRARRDETGLRVSSLVLTTDHAQVDAAGSLSEGQSRLDLDAALTNAALVLPQISGPVTLAVDARQSGTLWTTRVDAAGPGGTTLGYSGSLEGDFVDTLALRGDLRAEIGSLARYAGLLGRPVSGALRLRASGAGEVFAQRFDATVDATGTSLRSGVTQLDAFLTGVTQMSGRMSGEAGQLRLDGVQLDGSGLDATLSGTLSSTASDLRFAAAVADLARLVPDLPGPARAEGTAQSTGGPWRIAVTGVGPGGITLETRGSVAQDASRANLSASGVVPLALLNPRIRPRSVAGLARFDLALDGAPALSSLSGTVSAEDVRVALPDLRNALTGVSMRAQLGGNRAAVEAAGQLGSGGTFRVSGPVALAAPYSADLTARLTNIALAEPGLFETIANGRVTLAGPLTGGARIGGRIELETVEARIPSFGPSYQVLEGLRHASPPPDVLRTLQFAGLNATPQASAAGSGRIAFPLDLVIAAPNRIFVRGRGLDAEMGGQLRLTGSTDDVVPQGQFDLVRGRLDLLGKRLVLTEGSIGLRGSFDPVLRLAAETEVDDTTITIAIEGLASDPQLSLTSAPQLPEDEVLSLLLFGRSVTSISPLQAVQLAQAVRTLSGRGGGGLTEQLRSGLGVDDLDIGTNADGTAQARVGAYISENIYTDVTVTADGDSEINLNLDITPNLTLRGRAGSDGDSGIGLFFQRDY